MKLSILIAQLVLTLLSLEARASNFSTASLLVEEVLSASDDPHAFDWFATNLKIDLGVSVIQESNSFEASSYGLELSRSFSRGRLARLAVRKVDVSETASSRLLGLTPFTQAAQPSRFETLAGIAYSLIEGRGRTPLGAKLTDIGQGLQLLLGLQYNHFFDENEEILSGMQAVRYKFVGETGLRYQLMLPQSFGIAFEWTYSIPLTSKNPDLPSWQRVGGSLSWSFGR